MSNDLDQATLLAAIDIGTVSTRLIVARCTGASGYAILEREATITDLGEGVDATGILCEAAVERTLQTVASYVACLRAQSAAAGNIPVCVVTTTTSAARDAANAHDLLDPLRALGLAPQVIAGPVEAALALLGVTADFPGTPLLVADIGGGSTELTAGLRRNNGTLQRESCVSYNVGCRRVAERFNLATEAASPQAIAEARAWIACQFEDVFAVPKAERLLCVGGTATSLVAVAHRLVPYDSAFVHLHTLDRPCVHELAQRLLALPVSDRAALPGLQPKRAAVIGAGALILDEILELGGFSGYTASESDSLFGLLACLRALQEGKPSPLEWTPQTAFIT